jgi:DNA-binding transcriptional LysR family regulator
MEIVIGTRQELGMSWLFPQLDRLSQIYPSLDLHLYFGSGPDLLLRVRTMEIDCAVTSSRSTDPKLDSVRLHREDYVFVGSEALLRKRPLARDEDAKGHTLLDASPDLPLFRYFRDAPGGGDRLTFQRIVRLGSIEAIRQRVAANAGVAVLPEYLVRGELAAKKMRRIFPKVTPIPDYFRLVFRADDTRRPVYVKLAESMLEVPLR